MFCLEDALFVPMIHNDQITENLEMIICVMHVFQFPARNCCSLKNQKKKHKNFIKQKQNFEEKKMLSFLKPGSNFKTIRPMIDKKGSLKQISKTYEGTIESLGTAGLQQGFDKRKKLLINLKSVINLLFFLV